MILSQENLDELWALRLSSISNRAISFAPLRVRLDLPEAFRTCRLTGVS